MIPALRSGLPAGEDLIGKNPTSDSPEESRRGLEQDGRAMNLDDKMELLGELLEAAPPAGGDQEALLSAVGQAFHCLAERGEDPEHDKWLTNRDLFLGVVKPLIAEHWRESAGPGQEDFPWDDDYLVRVWLEWRMPRD
jgi:hypothetical protein